MTDYSNMAVKDLVKLLKQASDAYYNTDKNIMTDEQFDKLLDILKTKSPNNAFLKQVGAPIKVTREKTKLPYAMGSLDKIKPDTDYLTKWLKKYSGPYNLSDKLDGMSAQFYRESETKYKLYSHGDGINGSDISELIPYLLKDIIIPVGTSVRGEIIMSKINFKNPIMKDRTNARSSVAGVMTSKHMTKNLEQ